MVIHKSEITILFYRFPIQYTMLRIFADLEKYYSLQNTYSGLTHLTIGEVQMPSWSEFAAETQK